MRLLLDTHIALWAVTGQSLLSREAARLIQDSNNVSFVSAASIWEIAIKSGQKRNGPGSIPVSPARALVLFDEAGFHSLSIRPDHAAAVADLPPLHADPFDRLLVAQALSEPLRLLTHDARLARYSDTIIHV